MIEEPGYRMDKAVAKACEIGYHDCGDHIDRYIEELGEWHQFSPSGFVEDAIYAADAAWMVDTIHVVHEFGRDKNLNWYANIGGCYGHAGTLPLAICLMLLKLKESPI